MKIMKDETFENRNKRFLKKMTGDKLLRKLSQKWFDRAFNYEYSFHFKWLGRPIIQFPQDMVAVQEIIWKTKPDFIIETGIAHGGSIIFSASMLELLGKGKVIGIDIDIRKHNKMEIEKHSMYKRIIMIEGSSTENQVIDKVKKLVKGKKKVLVFLDSFHTQEHVLKELDAYSKFVSKGGYLVVFDTMIEDMPKNSFSKRPWNKNNNPKTAVKKFLNKNKCFKIDKDIERKLLITSCPSGYLKRIR